MFNKNLKYGSITSKTFWITIALRGNYFHFTNFNISHISFIILILNLVRFFFFNINFLFYNKNQDKLNIIKITNIILINIK